MLFEKFSPSQNHKCFISIPQVFLIDPSHLDSNQILIWGLISGCVAFVAFVEESNLSTVQCGIAALSVCVSHLSFGLYAIV